MIEKRNIPLLLAIAIVLAACGGGDGGSAAPTPAAATTAAGKAVDGYLSAASVLCDANKNGVADSSESVVVTDSQGNFAFSPACSSSIVASGGTNVDTRLPFAGLLKAPAGSTVVTPLTSLMAATDGPTAAKIAFALGLPAGIDVTQVDPAARNADRTLINADLLRKTVAVHQIIQQVADTLGSLAQDTSPESTQAIYSEVANAAAATLVANPTTQLVDSGSVSLSLVSGIVQKTMENVTITANTALDTVKANLGAYSAGSVSALVSEAIKVQAETLVQSTDAALTQQTTSLQSNPVIANTASQLAALLTIGIANKIDLTAMGTDLRRLADTNTNNDSAASTALMSEVTLQTGKAGIAPLSIDFTDLSKPNNYFAIRDDSVNLNGHTYTLDQFMNGVSLAQKPSSINTVGFGLIVKGNPIPKNSQGVRTTKVALGIEVTDTGASGRVLQFVLDRADLTLDSNKQLLISVPADSNLYVYSKTSSGISVNKTLTNLNAHQFIAVDNNTLTVNADKVLNQIGLTSLPIVTGAFNLKMVVSNVKIGSQIDHAVTGMSITVTGPSPHRVSGLGVEGGVVVQ
ncbi:hypothetical protein SAMN04515617_10612 [Collimonas sp. OK242]|jgi:hypothetical protein|uniref:hypothetical protein n=1 Tax=Collimonas sp. OK242 TaxID=1798195 RepID=UPI000895A4E5|nr:hypothetical protein [Collimonas sp. OK242]SDX70176.1 hypothetical protein SAMN04515617_10612 [Collimonas sp. OK242]